MADITSSDSSGAERRRIPLVAFAVIVLGLTLGGMAAGVVALSTTPATATAPASTPALAVAATTPTEIPPIDTPAAVTPTSQSPATAAAATATTTPTPASAGRFAFLLLGYGGGGHDGSLLTDAMMVVIGDSERKTLALLSLPRDIWAPLGSSDSPTYAKLNTAFAQATIGRPTPTARWSIIPTEDHYPGQFALQTIEQLIGIKLDYYVALDFQGFREAVDALGGIDVIVPNGFTSQYPRNDDPSIDAGWKIVSFSAGPQRMDGDRALVYTRARLAIDNSGEGSDFARAGRQRIVFGAIKDRLLSATGLAKLPALLAIASERTRTDYPIPATADLAKLLVSARDVQIYQATLGLDNYLVEGTGPQGAYILVPSAAGGSWAQVRAFTRRFRDEPANAEAVAAHRLTIVDRSGTYGLGSRVARRLSALGYPVRDVTTGASRASTTLLVRGGSDAAARALGEALQRDLGLKALASQIEPARAYAFADATLELGADATLAIADLPPADSDAPTSAYGVEHFGQWIAPPAPTANILPADRTGTATIPGTLTPIAGRTTGTPGTVSPAATISPVVPASPRLPTAPTATPATRAAPTPPPAATSKAIVPTARAAPKLPPTPTPSGR